MALFSVGVAVTSLRFFVLPLVDASGLEFGSHLARHGHLFFLHAGSGIVALSIGWLQFLPTFRARYPWAHRAVGRVYVIAIAVGGVSGLAIALGAYGGSVAQTGFVLLALAWLATTTVAFRYARRRQWAAHRAWMIRSFAVTFAAVTLRLWLPLLQVAGFDFASAYRIVAWLSWVPNLFAAEWVVARGTRKEA